MHKQNRLVPSKFANSYSSIFQWIILSVVACVPILAQAQVLEEIIVTAQKREQSIQDIGISMTAFSGEQIDQLGFQENTEVARLTPGVMVSANAGGQDAQFTIRGVTQTDFADFVEGPNAVYIDEGYMSNVQGQRFGLFDIERVEILKGPQGTLFGRNATGGLVHFVTRKPTDEFEAFGNVTYGSYDQIRFEGAVSGPLTENVSGRLSGLFNRYDEVIDNNFPAGQVNHFGIPAAIAGPGPFQGSRAGAEDYWNQEAWALRAQLLWEINDDAEFLVSAFFSRDDQSVAQYEQGQLTPIIDANGIHINSIFSSNDPLGCEGISFETGACVDAAGGVPVDGDAGDVFRPVVGGDLFGFTDPGGGGDQEVSVDHALDDSNFYDSEGVTGRLTWEFDDFTLTSITHYVSYEKFQSLDTDVSPIPQSIVMTANQTDTFSEEIRLTGELDRTRWVLGFYYLSIDNSHQQGLGFSPDSPITLIFNGGVPFENNSYDELDTDSVSLFGQVDYDLTDQLTLIGGVRLIREEKEFSYEQLALLNNDDTNLDPRSNTIVGPVPNYPTFRDETSETLWAAKLGVEFHQTDDWMWYASFNRGVKAGSFNGKLNDFTRALTDQEIPYEEEVLYAFEGGFKSTVWDGRAQVNANYYYYDYNDYQAFLFVGSSGFVRNADAEYQGIELQIASRPTDNLDVLFNVSWIDAEVSDLPLESPVNPNIFRFIDVEPAHTPEWQLGGLARYTWPDTLFGGDVALQIDFNYAGSRFHNIRNFDGQKMEDYVLVNTNLSWQSGNSGWNGTFFVRNLTDEDYKTTGFDLATLCGCAEESWGEPRWFGVTLGYKWQ